MERKTALIVGATGLVGRELVEQLLSGDYYASVSVLVRGKLELEHHRLKQHIIDFDDLEQYRELIAADDVYCCLGTTMRKAGSRAAFYRVDFGYPLAVANIAHQNGSCQYLLVSALGASTASSNYYYRVKGEVEEAIRQLKFRTVIIVRPSLLLGERVEKRLGESIAKAFFRCFGFAFVGSLQKYRPVAGSRVARAMVAFAQRGLPGVHIVNNEAFDQPGP